MMHIADNQDALLDYLYEEGDPAERLKIAQHLQECASCSVAVLELRTVRGMLTEWQPPTADLGFRIVQDTHTPTGASMEPRARGGWSWWWGPTTHRRSWAQAAAAAMLFVAGMAVSQFDVDYSDGALTVRTVKSAVSRTATDGRTAASIYLPPEPAVESSVSRTATGGQAATNGPAATDSTVSTEQLLQRVRAMIDQSETRQQRELALRLSQVAGEVDTQHQADLLRIQQNFGQQQEMMDYLVKASGGQK
ncbi:MAG TPA: zf-HC2 domain-containing protein [Vicinamibacterales bacterium]|nr:zf-HC2 domain-containing protein [Vicinamibacterales bacterium]